MSRIYKEPLDQKKRLSNRKKREDMNMELTKEDRQVANKQLKKCLT